MSARTTRVPALDRDVVKVRQDGALVLLTVIQVDDTVAAAAALDARQVARLVEVLGGALVAMLPGGPPV